MATKSKKIPKINVVIRKRPLSKKELANEDMDIVISEAKTIKVRELKKKVDLTKYIEEHNFHFDDTFDQNCDNKEVYARTVKPLVDFAFSGAKVTCFAYGQTGSGKTYTMIGDYSHGKHVEGLYVLAAHDIFDYLKRDEFSHLQILTSFYEIYCGKLFDLLNNRKILFPREDAKQKMNIVGLQQYRIENVDKLMEIISFGSKNRVTSMTGMNHDSSRSHAILQINIVKGNKSHGKVSFIDLAGNERGADTYDQDKQTRMDGAEINKSLLALKECIRALDQDKSYTPFRGSKLTMVLKDSFVGNCKTVMIGNISPSFSCCEHTLNTLRYADRVKELKKGNKTKKRKDDLASQLMLPRQHNRTQKFEVGGKVLRDAAQNKVKKFRKKSPTPKKRGVRKNNFINNKELIMEMERSKKAMKKQPYGFKNPTTNHAKDQPKESNNLRNPQANNMLTPLIQPEPMQMPVPMKQPNRHQILGEILNLDELGSDSLNSLHERLIGVILSEEEDLITSHKTHVEKMCDFSRTEFELLRKVEKPGSDIDEYVDSLAEVLGRKKAIIQGMKTRLCNFKQHLMEEQLLSSYCSEKQSEMERRIGMGELSIDSDAPGSGKENIAH